MVRDGVGYIGGNTDWLRKASCLPAAGSFMGKGYRSQAVAFVIPEATGVRSGVLGTFVELYTGDLARGVGTESDAKFDATSVRIGQGFGDRGI